MTYFEILQTANAIAGLGFVLYFCFSLKRFLKGYLKASR